MTENSWPLQKGAEYVFWVLHHLCPFWVVIDRRESNEKSQDGGTDSKGQSQYVEKWDRWRAGWLLGSLALLFGMWLWNPGSGLLMTVFVVIALWRLLEIFTTSLGTALLQEQQVRARSLITIGIYGMQLTLIFAILYHGLATAAFVADCGSATSAGDYLYISWSNITSLGNSIYVPANHTARFLEVATSTAGILLLGVLLAFGIDAVKPDDSESGSGAKAS